MVEKVEPNVQNALRKYDEKIQENSPERSQHHAGGGPESLATASPLSPVRKPSLSPIRQFSLGLKTQGLRDTEKQGENLPTVNAFLLENNLRNVLQEIIDPIVCINKENNTRLGNLESVTKDIESM